MNWFGIKRAMSDDDRSGLDRRIAESEKITGAQIVLSVIDRCDSYQELPWKAFAMGASLSGLAIIVIDITRSVWISGTTILLAVSITLAVGFASALLCIFVPGFARFFLDKDRAEIEARQYAESLFLSRELFATSKRTGILLLIGLFERQVILLPDTGLYEHLDQTAVKEIIARMTNTLASGKIADSLEEGLRGLEKVLSTTSPITSGKNELPNNVLEEEGP